MNFGKIGKEKSSLISVTVALAETYSRCHEKDTEQYAAYKHPCAGVSGYFLMSVGRFTRNAPCTGWVKAMAASLRIYQETKICVYILVL